MPLGIKLEYSYTSLRGHFSNALLSYSCFHSRRPHKYSPRVLLLLRLLRRRARVNKLCAENLVPKLGRYTESLLVVGKMMGEVVLLGLLVPSGEPASRVSIRKPIAKSMD